MSVRGGGFFNFFLVTVWRQSCDKSTVKLSTTVAFCDMSTVEISTVYLSTVYFSTLPEILQNHRFSLIESGGHHSYNCQDPTEASSFVIVIIWEGFKHITGFIHITQVPKYKYTNTHVLSSAVRIQNSV